MRGFHWLLEIDGQGGEGRAGSTIFQMDRPALPCHKEDHCSVRQRQIGYPLHKEISDWGLGEEEGKTERTHLDSVFQETEGVCFKMLWHPQVQEQGPLQSSDGSHHAIIGW